MKSYWKFIRGTKKPLSFVTTSFFGFAAKKYCVMSRKKTCPFVDEWEYDGNDRVMVIDPAMALRKKGIPYNHA